MTDSSGLNLPKGEEPIKIFVARYGPVAIGIYAEDLVMYESGIFDEANCGGKEPDHAVLAVGYGTDAKVGDYWILKNSWGSQWGDKGYLKIKRGVGMCNIGQAASIAKF